MSPSSSWSRTGPRGWADRRHRPSSATPRPNRCVRSPTRCSKSTPPPRSWPWATSTTIRPDESVEVHLGAKAKIKELQPGDFYTPFADMLKAGLGTLAYRDAWNLFDNIVVSGEPRYRLRRQTENSSRTRTKRPNSTAISSNPPTSSSRRGSIRVIRCLRTFVSNNFQGGFSDHLPVFIYIAK